jgi:leucyl aminopeptidase
MRVTVQQGSITDVQCDAIIVNLFLGVTRPGGATGAVDRALDGLISRTIPEWETSGQLAEILSLQTGGKIPAKEVIVVGLGRSDGFSYEAVERVTIAALCHAAGDPGIKRLATIIHGTGIGGLDVERAAAAVARGAVSVYCKDSEGKSPQWAELVIVEFSADKIDDIKRGISSVQKSDRQR